VLSSLLKYLESEKKEQLIGMTSIMIFPGYDFKIVRGLVTNFHQPKSTLLLLISAFVNQNWKEIYQYALNHQFRFLSYGDSSILLR
jgi:S-adenosylmethionine:tRNA ribosyltransferase-isomerase